MPSNRNMSEVDDFLLPHNFIINKNNATGEDVLNLINLAKKEVKEKFDIELKQEQELFNFD